MKRSEASSNRELCEWWMRKKDCKYELVFVKKMKQKLDYCGKEINWVISVTKV